VPGGHPQPSFDRGLRPASFGAGYFDTSSEFKPDMQIALRTPGHSPEDASVAEGNGLVVVANFDCLGLIEAENGFRTQAGKAVAWTRSRQPHRLALAASAQDAS